MSILPENLSHLLMLLVSGLVFHTILWARNGRFLWRKRRVILGVIAFAEIWMLITDPIGGAWGAWYFSPDKVLGIWIIGNMPLEDALGVAIISSAAACAVLVFGYGPRRWI